MKTFKNSIFIITLSMIMIIGCKKDENFNNQRPYPDYFNDKAIIEIAKINNKILFISSRPCSECEIPIWQSFIPYKFQISEVENNNFKTNENVSEIYGLLPYKTSKYLAINRNNVLIFNEINHFDTLLKVSTSITSLAIDTDNKLWLGSHENGFTIINNNESINYNTNNSSLPTNEIHEIVINKATNEKWISLGIPYNGLLHIVNQKWTYYKCSEITDIGYLYFSRLLIDKASNLWLTGKTNTNSNLLKFNGNNWENVKPIVNGQEIECFAMSINADENGDLWIINKNNEILNYNGNVWKKIAIPENDFAILSLLRIDNQLYIGTNLGLKIIKLD